MKEKIINYIETLEAKSLQVDDYFKQRNELYISNQEKNFEIERLNNIINELEKWVEEDENKAMITFETGRCFNYHDIINKIEELKGSDK